MEKPYLQLIRSSRKTDEALIFLDGYQSKYKNDNRLWSKYLDRADWQGSIYRLWWDAGCDYGRKYLMSPLGYIPIVNELAHSYPHWRMVVKRAEVSGLKFLPSLISSIPERNVSLIGYSLGCRLIHYGINRFEPKRSSTSIKNIILLAGAIRTIKWEKIAKKIDGNIYNLHNNNDWILNNLFTQFGLYMYKPCGVSPIKSRHEKIKNIDITRQINTQSHDLKNYLRILSRHNYLK